MLSDSGSPKALTALAAAVAAVAVGAVGAALVWPENGRAALGARAASPKDQVAISPAPGTPDASPATQISILGITPRRIRSVRVTGSASGIHDGQLRAYSGARGGSFLLTRPLTQGEQVTVRVTLGRHPAITSTFTVAHLASTPPVINIRTLQLSKLSRFASEPALLPPRISVHKHSSSMTGDVFLTPLPSPIIHPESNNALTIHPVGPGGPMIIDGRGRLVWFHQLLPPLVATDFRRQRYRGHEVLTWWQGAVTASAFGIGEGVMADTAYRTLKRVRTGNGYPADLHEFLITPSGDALFTVDSPVLTHLPGSPAGELVRLQDSIAQEVDIGTGLVVWEWHSLGHIPLADSYATPANSAAYDAYHLNSIQPLAHHRLLISARDTSAVYLVDQASGRILWTLGGKASSFRLGRGARFFFQHDAKMLGRDEVTLFDDEAGPPIKAAFSRGLRLSLDLRRRTATLVRQYRRPGHGTLAESEGSVQSLAGGRTFVGFGSTPFFTEFSPTGRLLFDASLPTDDGSYREFASPWTARPRTRPAVAVKRTAANKVTVYASWNGATGVARWQVLAVARHGSPSPVAGAPDRGFETAIPVGSSANGFAVRALSASGRVQATSAIVPAS